MICIKLINFIFLLKNNLIIITKNLTTTTLKIQITKDLI